jgi:hypothetical protein
MNELEITSDKLTNNFVCLVTCGCGPDVACGLPSCQLDPAGVSHICVNGQM